MATPASTPADAAATENSTTTPEGGGGLGDTTVIATANWANSFFFTVMATCALFLLMEIGVFYAMKSTFTGEDSGAGKDKPAKPKAPTAGTGELGEQDNDGDSSSSGSSTE